MSRWIAHKLLSDMMRRFKHISSSVYLVRIRVSFHDLVCCICIDLRMRIYLTSIYIDCCGTCCCCRFHCCQVLRDTATAFCSACLTTICICVMFSRQMHRFIFNCLFNNALENIVTLTTLIYRFFSCLVVVHSIVFSMICNSTVDLSARLHILGGNWPHWSIKIILGQSIRLLNKLFISRRISICHSFSLTSQSATFAIIHLIRIVLLHSTVTHTARMINHATIMLVLIISPTHWHRGKCNSFQSGMICCALHFGVRIKVLRIRYVISIVNSRSATSTRCRLRHIICIIGISWISFSFLILKTLSQIFRRMSILLNPFVSLGDICFFLNRRLVS